MHCSLHLPASLSNHQYIPWTKSLVNVWSMCGVSFNELSHLKNLLSAGCSNFELLKAWVLTEKLIAGDEGLGRYPFLPTPPLQFPSTPWEHFLPPWWDFFQHRLISHGNCIVVLTSIDGTWQNCRDLFWCINQCTKCHDITFSIFAHLQDFFLSGESE